MNLKSFTYLGKVTTVSQRSRRIGRRGRRGTITRQQAVTRAAREWRVYYECVGAAQNTAGDTTHQVTITF